MNDAATITRSALTLCFLALPTLASAQRVDPYKDDGSGWIAYAIAGILVAAIAVGSFMTSKRSHQD